MIFHNSENIVLLLFQQENRKKISKSNGRLLKANFKNCNPQALLFQVSLVELSILYRMNIYMMNSACNQEHTDIGHTVRVRNEKKNDIEK